jgi:type II secretory pathway predicted ATPase ExeA
MYESHFGLRRRPFRAIPDSGFYYPASGHERAFAQLRQALADDEGLALLIGEPGTGKTLLAHCLLDQLDEKTATAFLTNSHFQDRAGLLQAILYDLSVPYEGLGEQQLRLALTDFLLKNYQSGRRALLLVDEAQNLTPDLLEELRLQANLEGDQGKAVQIVLLAQPEIEALLNLPGLAVVRQRLAVEARLEPLGLHEAADYLIHQLRAAGGKPEDLMSDEAIAILARGTRGIPRLLNRAAHQAFTLAFTAEAKQVDAEAALEALSVLGLSECEEPAPPESSTDAADDQGDDSSVDQETESGPVLAIEDAFRKDERAESEGAGLVGRARRLFGSPRRPA